MDLVTGQQRVGAASRGCRPAVGFTSKRHAKWKRPFASSLTCAAAAAAWYPLVHRPGGGIEACSRPPHPTPPTTPMQHAPSTRHDVVQVVCRQAICLHGAAFASPRKNACCLHAKQEGPCTRRGHTTTTRRRRYCPPTLGSVTVTGSTQASRTTTTSPPPPPSLPAAAAAATTS